jgi:hypothetical protein
VCCLDHLIYHRNAWNIDLAHAYINVSEDFEDIVSFINALERRLSVAPHEAPAFVRPFPIIEAVDDFILQKCKRKFTTARSRDSLISDLSQELLVDPCSILPPSFQHQPFSIALRMNHLREFRDETPQFFEGSSSKERMQNFNDNDSDDSALNHKRVRNEAHVEKSIERYDCSTSMSGSSLLGSGIIGSASKLRKRGSSENGEPVSTSYDTSAMGLQTDRTKTRGELLRLKREQMTQILCDVGSARPP